MEKIWLQSYPTHIQSSIEELSNNSILDLIQKASDKYSSNTAFTSLNSKLSFKDIEFYSENFGAYLQHELSILKGSRVAIMLPNLFTYPVTLLGCYKAGATVININPLYKGREIENALNDSGAETIIVLDKFIDELNLIIKNTKIKNVIVCHISDLLSLPMSLLIKTISFFKRSKTISNDNYIPFFRVILKKHILKKVNLYHDDIALLQYTGGTTGKSKAAVLTHKNILSNIQQLDIWVKPHISKGKEIIITALPLYHIFSFTVNFLYFYSIGSNNVLIANPRDLKSFVKELTKHKFTVITAVNTLFNLLLTSSKFRKIDFSPLKFSVGGGMAVLSSTAKRWKKITGTEITQGYGLTETSPIVSINPINTKFNGSIGLPVPSTDISIRDDTGNQWGYEEPGELCVKGPQVMSEYWNKKHDSLSSFTKDGFFKTGDIASIDKNGFLTIVDRKKDMIISSGFNVYPNEIEEYVSQHPYVTECGVIGIDDSNRGESIHLFIVRSSDTLREIDIIEFCKEGLTIYKVPKKVHFINEIPKNNVGKILRRKLRELKY
ncbi:MAG: AMP-binding protein [Pseudomonadota bacterium]|nr:AMP-binding protein [Pseudomonadota bacterium]